MTSPTSAVWRQLVDDDCQPITAALDDASVLQVRKENTGRSSGIWKVDMTSDGYPRLPRQSTGKPPVAVCYGIIWFYMVGKGMWPMKQVYKDVSNRP